MMETTSRLATWLWWVGLLVLGSSMSLSQAEAGPWSKQPGHLYLRIGQDFYVARDFVGPSQGVSKGANYFGTQTSLYTEIGLFYGLEFIGFLPYKYGHIDYEDSKTTYRLNGPGDAVVGLQWTPPPLERAAGFPIALRLTAKLPMYNAGLLAESAGADSINFPSLGDGQLDMTVWISAGGQIPNYPFQVFAEVGYRVRTELFFQGQPLFQGVQPDNPLTFLDTFVFRAELRWNFAQKMIATVTFSGAVPLGANSVTKGHINLGFGLYLPIAKGFAFEAALSPNVWAQSAARGASIVLGLSYNR